MQNLPKFCQVFSIVLNLILNFDFQFTFNKWMCAPLKHISFTILYGESPWRYWSSLKKKCQQDPSQKEWYVFADFVLRHLALPASSASCERLFYRQNMNVPPNRARMKEKTAIARIIIGRK